MKPELNEGQKRVVECNDKHICVIAGAGAGKTFSMIERIVRLIKDGVPPKSILALTFTNAAAFEMRERFNRKNLGVTAPEFRTFHSFCYKLITHDRPVLEAIGYTKIPSIADNNIVKAINQEVKLKYNIKVPSDILNQSSDIPLKYRDEYNIFHKAVRKELNKRGIITFDILCYDVCKLFVDNDPVVFKYKDQYKHILIDEFQDTDPKQWKFAKSFEDSSITVIGDCLQGIYAFRNGDSSIMKALSKGEDNFTVIKLPYNYRSTKQICEFANNMSTYADDSYRIELLANKEGPDVVVEYTHLPHFPQCVSTKMMANIAERYNLLEGESAILCRTNAEIVEVVDYMTNRGISCRTSRKHDAYVHFIKSAESDEYLLSWMSSTLSQGKYEEWLRCSMIDNEKSSVEYFINKFSTKKMQSQYKQIVKMRKILFNLDLIPYEKITKILHILKLDKIAIDTTASTIPEIVEYLVEKIQEDGSASLYVGTIHSAKGLEYDNVFLINVNTRLFPLDDEEKLNLYYVGITRAKSNLIVYGN